MESAYMMPHAVSNRHIPSRVAGHFETYTGKYSLHSLSFTPDLWPSRPCGILEKSLVGPIFSAAVKGTWCRVFICAIMSEAVCLRFDERQILAKPRKACDP